jgi:pyruvate kinase
LYRGVYPVNFDVMVTDSGHANQEIIDTLLQQGVVSHGDLIIITKGDLNGISGGTNSMKIMCVERE